MPSLVILIDNIADDDMEKIAISASEAVQRQTMLWAFESDTISDSIPEACFQAHKAELERKEAQR